MLLLYATITAIVIYLILNRIKEKKEENFENRDN
ncbi:MAG: hypothetical protein CM15mP65_04720 [Crocinitomicaceae bacterium]|nr:MAG: hypothetical protein CM15mP65_04720 [Crocinitomicaceae bacterium]